MAMSQHLPLHFLRGHTTSKASDIFNIPYNNSENFPHVGKSEQLQKQCLEQGDGELCHPNKYT